MTERKEARTEEVNFFLADLDDGARLFLAQQLGLIEKKFPRVFQDAVEAVDLYHGRSQEGSHFDIVLEYQQDPQQWPIFEATLTLYSVLMTQEPLWELIASRGTAIK